MFAMFERVFNKVFTSNKPVVTEKPKASFIEQALFLFAIVWLLPALIIISSNPKK